MLERITEKLQIFKRIKIRTILLIIVLLIFNSYAWFIYATRVSTGLTAHVTAWNINFQVGNEEVNTDIVCDVDRIYPGMPDYIKEITVSNRGEVVAQLDYEINSFRVLDNYFETGLEHTSNDLIYMLENNYPFKLNVIIEEATLNEPNGQGFFTIKVSWPYESGDDTLDTYWGERAYDYLENNPGATSLLINLKLLAKQ